MLIMSTIMREMAPSMKYFLYFFMKTLYIKFSLRIDEKNIVVTYSLYRNTILFKKTKISTLGILVTSIATLQRYTSQ